MDDSAVTVATIGPTFTGTRSPRRISRRPASVTNLKAKHSFGRIRAWKDEPDVRDTLRNREHRPSRVQGDRHAVPTTVGGDHVIGDPSEGLPRVDAKGTDIIRASCKQVEASSQISVMSIEDQGLAEECAKDDIVQIAGNHVKSWNHGQPPEPIKWPPTRERRDGFGSVSHQ